MSDHLVTKIWCFNHSGKKKQCKVKPKRIQLRGISGEFEAFTLTSAEADIIPVRYLMLVNTDSASTGISASINLRHATDCNTSIRDWILGESSNFIQQSLWCTNSLTHENIISTLFPPLCTLTSLLFSMLSSNEDVTDNSSWDRSP